MAVLTRYGNKNNVSNFDYEKAQSIVDLESLKNFVKEIKEGCTRKEQEKENERIAVMIYEANLRGIKLGNAGLHSHFKYFAIDPESGVIVRPMSSIAGIAIKTAELIYNDIKENGIDIGEMLAERTAITFDENGKMKTKKIFSPSILEKLGLEGPKSLTEEEKIKVKEFKIKMGKKPFREIREEIAYFIKNPPRVIIPLTEEEKLKAKEFKIKFGKADPDEVRKEIQYYIENPPYLMTKKDEAEMRLLGLKKKDFKDTTLLKAEIDKLKEEASEEIKNKLIKINERYA